MRRRRGFCWVRRSGRSAGGSATTTRRPAGRSGCSPRSAWRSRSAPRRSSCNGPSGSASRVFSEERARIALAGLLALLALGTGVLIGRATSSPHGGVLAAATIVHGVPVGVQDTAAGALAAADNYLAIASQTVEQNPAQ